MNLVQKYGGESIDSLQKVRDIAQNVAAAKKPGDGLVIVTGAMTGLTENIINMANAISRRQQR